MTFRIWAVEWEETVHEAGREKADDPAFAPPPTLTRNQTLPQKRRAFLIVMGPPGTIKPSIRHPQQEKSECPTSSTH